MTQANTGEKIKALLATGRIANLPTVWSNVFISYWLTNLTINSLSISENPDIDSFKFVSIIALAASFIYVGGCMLGDVVDIEFDRKNRPNRPLPQGILKKKHVKFLSLTLLLAGTLLAIFSNILTTLILLSAVVLYANFHKRLGKKAVFLMASCRFFLILFAAAFVTKEINYNPQNSFSFAFYETNLLNPLTLVIALIVAIYTLLLSWVASTESEKGAFQKRNILVSLMLLLPLSTLCFIFPHFPHLPSSIFYLLSLYLWLFFTIKALKTSKPTFVSRALAGFCLLDAAIIAPFSPIVAGVCFVFFLLALSLQKLAPAT